MKHLFSVMSQARSPRVPPSQDALAKAYANGFEDGSAGVDAARIEAEKSDRLREENERAHGAALHSLRQLGERLKHAEMERDVLKETVKEMAAYERASATERGRLRTVIKELHETIQPSQENMQRARDKAYAKGHAAGYEEGCASRVLLSKDAAKEVHRARTESTQEERARIVARLAAFSKGSFLTVGQVSALQEFKVLHLHLDSGGQGFIEENEAGDESPCDTCDGKECKL